MQNCMKPTDGSCMCCMHTGVNLEMQSWIYCFFFFCKFFRQIARYRNQCSICSKLSVVFYVHRHKVFFSQVEKYSRSQEQEEIVQRCLQTLLCRHASLLNKVRALVNTRSYRNSRIVGSEAFLFYPKVQKRKLKFLNNFVWSLFLQVWETWQCPIPLAVMSLIFQWDLGFPGRCRPCALAMDQW